VMGTLPTVVAPAPPLPAEPAAEQAALEHGQRQFIASLRDHWSLIAQLASPGERELAAATDVAEDVLRQSLHAVTAALLTGDPRPVSDTAAWIDDLLRIRGVDQTMVRELGDLLVEALRDYPLARDIVALHYPEGLADR
jgi:MerR family transcriptional regulator, light-induced transcriptional regulator